jgi:chromosome segregation ATPase
MVPLSSEKNEVLLARLHDLEREVNDLRVKPKEDELINELQEEVQALRELLQTANLQQEQLIHEHEELSKKYNLLSANQSSTENQQHQGNSSPSKGSPPPIALWAQEEELTQAKEKLRNYKVLENQLIQLNDELNHARQQRDQKTELFERLYDENSILKKNLEDSNTIRNGLVSDAKALDHAVEELTGQLDLIVKQRNNYKSLYSQLLEKTQMNASLDESQLAKLPCANCSAFEEKVKHQDKEIDRLRGEVDVFMETVKMTNSRAENTDQVYSQSFSLESQLETLKAANAQLNITLQQQLSIIQQQAKELSDANLEKSRQARAVSDANKLQNELNQTRIDLGNSQILLAEANQHINEKVSQINQLNHELQENEVEKKVCFYE